MRMNLKMQRLTNVGAVLLIATLLTGASCTAQGYAAASNTYNVNAMAYKAAGDSIQNLRGVGRVTDAQWAQFQAAAAAERAADAIAFADLDSWRISGNKPATFDANMRKLTDAQNVVIALSKQVQL